MSNKLNLADPVQTSVSAGRFTTNSVKDGERFGTTNVSISLTNAPLEDGDQESPFHSTAHDLNAALNDRDYDTHYDYDYAKALEKADYQRYLDLSQGIIKKPTIRVTLQEDASQIDKEGIIVPASELSLSDIGELFLLLLNVDAEFVLERGLTVFATWAMWAEKFFVHGCIAYLLYHQQATGSGTVVSSSEKQDTQMAGASVIEGNILMGHEHLLHDTYLRKAPYVCRWNLPHYLWAGLKVAGVSLTRRPCDQPRRCALLPRPIEHPP